LVPNYLFLEYNKSVAVTVREKDILIVAQGASFAGALRMQSRQMQRAASTTKRLIIRIA
jgi:BarA-like signal transduction histidine kinase